MATFSNLKGFKDLSCCSFYKRFCCAHAGSWMEHSPRRNFKTTVAYLRQEVHQLREETEWAQGGGGICCGCCMASPAEPCRSGEQPTSGAQLPDSAPLHITWQARRFPSLGAE